MTTAHTTTASLIVDDAAFLVGRKNIGNDLETADVTVFLRLLNDMIKQWEGAGVYLHTIQDVTVTLDGSSQSYTMSPTGDVVTGRPLRCISARRVDSDGYETPVELISREDYKRIPLKAATGPVTLAAYEKQATYGTLYVWPLGETTDTLSVSIQRPIDIFDSSTDAGDFPSEMFLALKYGLAAILADGTGLDLTVRQTIKAEARQYFDVLKCNDQETTSLFIQPRMR